VDGAAVAGHREASDSETNVSGVNFDRAAAFYDATRALPDGVAEEVCGALVRHVGAGPHTRFLEIGIGTGRIAVPFLVSGHRYDGIDLSAAMLAVLRAKLDPAARAGFAVADAASLPFQPAVFDVVLMIHVLHLVDDHRRALGEARAVLRRGGRLVVSANDFADRNRRDQVAGRAATGARAVVNRWNAILTDLGIDRGRRPRGQWLADETVASCLQDFGASVGRVVLARYRSRPQTAREAAAAHRDRIFSSDWDIPEHIHAEASRRLEEWLRTEHPEPDVAVSEDATFTVLVGTLPP
jgi:ubiquinone/menaquinone biosynthesis C-methylase UbiE